MLKGLSYRPTGAIVAAATASLPEQIGGERNWDYRYAWIRDASFTMQALYVGTCPDEVTDFVSFMTSSSRRRRGRRRCRSCTGSAGSAICSERVLAAPRGWRGLAPGADRQRRLGQMQLDVYGELLDALHLYREPLGELHPEIQRFAAALAETRARSLAEPDAGIWEMRGEPRHSPLLEGVTAGWRSTAP